MAKTKTTIHPSAIVETKKIGHSTRIWAYVHILKKVEIGNNCNICDHVFIEQNVKLGNNVTVKSGIYIWEGVEIADNVFLGPNVVFTNDIRPRSKLYKEPVKTIIEKGASVGANSTVLAGIIIGKYAMSGIGSVITRDVKPHALVYGNPAKQHGWVDEFGNKLKKKPSGKWISEESGQVYSESESGLKKIKK
ncbi:MAG TPA: acyltransferase [Bacteroidia bacterium]|nr:acyltransferase [Bacteroidia bacterium]